MLTPIALCLGRFSTFETKAQSVALECLISGEQRSEVLLVDPNVKSIKAGNRMIEAEVTAENIIWKEDGTIRVINRRTGAVLHRLPDESYFQIGQCRSSRKKL
jgi:hypothetical protein